MKNLAQVVVGKQLAKLKCDLPPGEYLVDETFTVHIQAVVKQGADQEVAPTTSIPYIHAMALLLEKAGVTRDAATRMLREALTEALESNGNRSVAIDSRINDVEQAVQVVREQVISQLPKVQRKGAMRVCDCNLEIEEIAEEAVAKMPK